jgi:hypothetical protein
MQRVKLLCRFLVTDQIFWSNVFLLTILLALYLFIKKWVLAGVDDLLRGILTAYLFLATLLVFVSMREEVIVLRQWLQRWEGKPAGVPERD